MKKRELFMCKVGIPVYAAAVYNFLNEQKLFNLTYAICSMNSFMKHFHIYFKYTLTEIIIKTFNSTNMRNNFFIFNISKICRTLLDISIRIECSCVINLLLNIKISFLL